MGKEKNGEKWRFFEAQKSAISLLRAGASKHKPLIWLLLCRPTFLATENKKNVGRHFLGEDFVDVTRRGRLSPDATNLGTCGRHGDAAQTTTLPWRGMSHYSESERICWPEGAYLRKPGQKISYDKPTKGQVRSRPLHTRNGRGQWRFDGPN